MKIAIVILNWNGHRLLEKFLPSVVNNSGNNPIYIIDNNSDDKSIDYLNKNYHNLKIIRNNKNYGYAKGYNEGLKHINEEIFCLLNNDVEVTKGWLDPMIKEFKSNKNLVIAQPKILDYNNKNKFEYAGAAGGFIDYYGYPYCRGRIFNEIEEDNGQYDQNVEIFWASGACFFIRKDIFNELGGFDENFCNHMEEIDLCWRTENLNKGYKKIFIHKSVIYHLGGASLDYNDPKKLFYNIRNHRWMLLKNTNANPYVFFNPFHLFSIIRCINFWFAFYNLLTLKFEHSREIFKGMFSVFTYKDGNKINIDNNYFLLRSNNKKPKHYVIKSILYNYLVLKKRKFSELNKS